MGYLTQDKLRLEELKQQIDRLNAELKDLKAQKTIISNEIKEKQRLRKEQRDMKKQQSGATQSTEDEVEEAKPVFDERPVVEERPVEQAKPKAKRAKNNNNNPARG